MASLNTVISPAPQVTCFTTGGQVATGYGGNVVMSMGNNPSDATLAGTLTVAAVAGVATFSNLSLNHSGKDFTIKATGSNLRVATSSPFSIPTHLSFTQQPSGAQAGVILDPVEVTAKDVDNNTDTFYTGDITVSIYSGTGTLSGALTQTAIAGVASFTNLAIAQNGTYTLIASGTEVSGAFNPASIVSDPFVIGPSYTLTAANIGGGAVFGFITGLGGSISPATLNGQTIYALESTVASNVTGIVLTGLVAQGFFTSMTVGATTKTSASASYSQGGGQTTWTWSATQLFTAATSYGVTIV